MRQPSVGKLNEDMCMRLLETNLPYAIKLWHIGRSYPAYANLRAPLPPRPPKPSTGLNQSPSANFLICGLHVSKDGRARSCSGSSDIFDGSTDIMRKNQSSWTAVSAEFECTRSLFAVDVGSTKDWKTLRRSSEYMSRRAGDRRSLRIMMRLSAAASASSMPVFRPRAP